MSIATETLPITEIQQPASQQELTELVRDCAAADTPMYPIGGGTSLRFGLPARREGIGISLAGMNRVVDYPARDMTITVEAGITMRVLAETLQTHQQRLPIDVPQSEQATLGGVVATNSNGPRRFGCGTVRDHVIGISAIDGRGTPYKGGGRVVKNVAGYDFCKLLTGSLGTLGVISQLTLKLRPIPPSLAFVVCQPADLDEADRALQALVHSDTTPAAVELLAGSAWHDTMLADSASLALAVAVEGTVSEVNWMVDCLISEWQAQGLPAIRTFADDEAHQFMQLLSEFPAPGDAPLVLQANVTPSSTTRLIAAARELDPKCSLQAHAANGIVIVRCSEFPESGLSKALVGNLQPAASAAHGNVIVLSNPSRAEMTHQSVWGGIDAPFFLMDAIKREFDPKNLLNPDRFVYAVTS